MKRSIYSICGRGMLLMLMCFLSSVAAMADDVTYDTWSVVGSKAIMNGDNDWELSETANDLSTTDGVNYTLTVTGKTLEVGSTYEYKFAHEHAWNDAYTFPSSNAQLTVTETAVYQIVYTINVTDKTYSAVATKTGETGEITHIYSIAGSSTALFGGSNVWDAANTSTEMTKGADGIYTWTKEGVALSNNVEFKVLVDHSMGEAYPSSNASISISGDATYNVTITFNPSTKEVSGTAEAQGTVTTNYYLKHSWDGTNWEWKKLAQNSDGTYSIIDYYGDNGCNYNTGADNTGAIWVEKTDMSGYDNVSKGDLCKFTLDPTAGTVTIAKYTKIPVNFYLIETALLPEGAKLTHWNGPYVQNGTYNFYPCIILRTAADDNPDVTYTESNVTYAHSNFTFTSDDEDIFVVDENGLATVKGVGTAHLIVTYTDPTNTYADATYTCEVNVSDDLNVTAIGQSKYLPAKVFNAYKNTVHISSHNRKAVLNVARSKKDGSDVVTIGTISYKEGTDEVIFTPDANYKDPTNMYDEGTVRYSGNFNDGVTIYDYLEASTANGGDQAECYYYMVWYSGGGMRVEVPVYGGSMSVYAMADVDNDKLYYTKAEILADTDHHLAIQGGFKLNYAVTSGDATKVTGRIYYRNAVDITDAASSVTAITETSTGTNIKVKERESTNFTTAMVVGDNTYGTNQVVAYLPIVSVDVTAKYSTHSATDATKDKPFTTVYTPYKTGYYYWSVQTANATNSSEFTNEGGGVRLWRSKVVTGLEKFENFTKRLTNFKYFDNMGTTGLSEKVWPVENIGTETINLTTEYGETKSVYSTMFGASSETLEPTETVVCRYYYRTPTGALNGVALPSSSSNAPAKVEANATDDGYAYYVAEQYKEIVFTGSSITTAVEDVTAAKTVVGIRYYNLAGVESDEPFEGVNIVVTRYTDGSISSSKVMR